MRAGLRIQLCEEMHKLRGEGRGEKGVSTLECLKVETLGGGGRGTFVFRGVGVDLMGDGNR